MYVSAICRLGPVHFAAFARKVFLFASTGAGRQMMTNLTDAHASVEEGVINNIIRNGVSVAQRAVNPAHVREDLANFPQAIAGCASFAQIL